MTSEFNDVTNPGLVGDLKHDRGDCWDQFYSFYAPMIISFARKKGCSDSMAEDVLQETIVALYKSMPNFEYDPNRGKFRSFLFRIASSKIIDSYRRGKRLVSIDDSEVMDKFNFDNEPEGESNEAWAETWDNNILARAIEAAQIRVSPKTFECFERTFIKGEPVGVVAEELDIEANLIYQHRHKVQTVILSEAKKLRTLHGE